MNGRPISGASVGVRRRRRGAGPLALALGAVLLATTACGPGDSGKGGDGDGNGGKKAGADPTPTDNRPSEAVVAVAPKDGAEAVATSGTLKVTAAKGKLTKVTVKDTAGNTIPGEIAKDGASWKPALHLAASTKYKVHVTAKDSAGRTAAKDTSFTTLTPQNTFIGHFTPEDGSKVGVGMPVSFNFTRGITNPADVARAIEVTAEPKVEIRHKWHGNDRLDFRPENYWKPGTKVSVKLNLDGVEGRDGVYGTQAKTVKFTVGRSQVSVVDAKKKTMTVKRDGKTLKTIPITAGAPSTTTYNGQMVITEKLPVTRMDGATVGFGGEYDIKDVPHAMRLSTSGTFIHGNYWASASTFGSENVSHGCIGLRDARGGYDDKTPGAWLFKKSMIGDVVIVKNSKDKQIKWFNGLNGWNLAWDEWEK
ncbi:L,D-transpeptidase [Streptomyces apocyni]|uniref:L,D-transpeptidase n=1 Tax=Streptomyces apocyni TaxID=2654677 RepID=UPI0012EA2FD6|nr:Ig-like domain-containing protein [Streptomyces apocyni]